MEGRIALPHNLQGIHDFSPLVALLIDLPLLADFHLQPLREGVHHGSSHAVEAAGDLVAPVSEFSAGVKNGEHHLHRRDSRLFLDPHRDAPPVVPDGDGSVVVDLHIYGVTEARECFIHRIVHDLIHQVVQTSGGGAADVHSRPLSNRLQALQNLNLICSVFSTHGISSCLMF